MKEKDLKSTEWLFLVIIGGQRNEVFIIEAVRLDRMALEIAVVVPCHNKGIRNP